MDTLLGIAIVIASFFWEHRAGVVALLALGFLAMIGNEIITLTAELHAVHETLKSVHQSLESIADKLPEKDDTGFI